MTDTLPSHLAGLLEPGAYPHDVSGIDIIETHISWIVLTGTYAYKLKKPVDLGFLDFSSLDRRHRACGLEVALNTRLAPELYLDVVAVRDDGGGASLAGTGRVVEYAVRMRQFPQEAQLDRLLAAGGVDAALLEDLAGRIARFHERAPVAPAGDPRCAPDAILGHMLDNFPPARAGLDAERARALDGLETWTRDTARAMSARLIERCAEGRVREGHGDLHLSNLVLVDDRVTAFDCIEFSEELRWIDVQSEIAFLVMDLMVRGRDDLAWAFLNAYLEASGDYRGVDVLRLYLVYRSMVRAKVAGLLSGELPANSADAAAAQERRARHIDLALRLASPESTPQLVLMHGLSGSGKSRLARRLAMQLGAVRLRSDVERKRLAGMPAREPGATAPDSGLYAPAMTRATYDRLRDLAAAILAARFDVIVDAAFLTVDQRQAFTMLAGSAGATLTIVACTASRATLEKRVARRAAKGKDASDATLDVLAAQFRHVERLTVAERDSAIEADTDVDADVEAVAAFIRRRRCAAAPPSPGDVPSSQDPGA